MLKNVSVYKVNFKKWCTSNGPENESAGKYYYKTGRDAHLIVSFHHIFFFLTHYKMALVEIQQNSRPATQCKTCWVEKKSWTT